MTTAGLVDWEGALGAVVALLGLMAIRAWLLKPSRRFPRLRLKRRVPLVESHQVLVLAPIVEDARGGRKHETHLRILAEDGFRDSKRHRMISHTRLCQ
jgi:hypothetical protein